MQKASITGLDRLLKVDEVCKVLGLSRTSIYGLIANGRLPGVKVQGARRFPESHVSRFIASLTPDP